MNTRSSVVLGIVGIIALIVMLGIFVAGISYSDPSEENISGSSSVQNSPANSDSSNIGRSEDQGDATSRYGENRNGDQADNPSDEASSTVAVPHPRATFLYTVRSGDTPGGIAAVFGVPVAQLLKLNHLTNDSELMIGDTLRVPNPFLTHERELSSELDRLTAEKQAAEQHAQKGETTVSTLRAQVNDLTTANQQYRHDLHDLPWWRGAALLSAGAAALMLGIMLVALVQWLIVRSRFRAVAEMNEALRRLDYKYKAALAKAELRFQELYGRRRRGVQDGPEPTKTPEEIEIEQLNRRLRDVLEHHLQRLEPSGLSARRARWRERVAAVGAPMEARSIRR
ncbi:MAG TPA: LysM peptidoglycan-binding domain-containing protein [Candidatus Binataceae bacterium]|nr:LysM peptidoglycan-binding domain-containing protein [Candidatus Binataceae bacterium]